MDHTSIYDHSLTGNAPGAYPGGREARGHASFRCCRLLVYCIMVDSLIVKLLQ